MNRSRAMAPTAPDLLEGRIVLSQVYFSPPLGLVGDMVAAVSTGSGKHLKVKAAAMVERTILEDGQLQVTNIVTAPIYAAGILTSMVTHIPDGTTRTINTTATTLHGTTNYTRGIILPDGSTETETGSEYAQPTATTIQPDGTLRPHPGGQKVSRVAVFDRVVTAGDQGSGSGSGSKSQTASGSIVGSTVTQAKGGRTIASTDEQVTNFDGSQMEVRVFTTIQNGTTTNRETILNFATGAVTTTTTTSRITSST